ncbi:hypothetical protein ACWM35_08800 [Neobacillus sp. K501]
MKKFVTLFCAGLLAFLLVASPVNSVFAAEGTSITAEEDGECGCVVTPIEGIEKYQIIYKLLVSKEFKKASKKLLKDGYLWDVTKEIEVLRNETAGGIIMVGVPFKNINGTDGIAAFFDGVYMGISPAEAPHNH